MNVNYHIILKMMGYAMRLVEERSCVCSNSAGPESKWCIFDGSFSQQSCFFSVTSNTNKRERHVWTLAATRLACSLDL